MNNRRSFLAFIAIRYLAWGAIAATLILLLGGLGLIDGLPIETVIALSVIGLIISFFEYDSLPRKIEIHNDYITLEDASGEIFTVREIGFRRCLWLTRIVFCRNRSIVSLPLEAFRSTFHLASAARKGLQESKVSLAEQQAGGSRDDHQD